MNIQTNIMPLLLIGVFLNAAAQLLLKVGMTSIGHFKFTLHNIIPVSVKVVLTPSILLGLSAYVVSVVIWMMVLSRVEVSFAYPLVSIGYIITAIAAAVWLNEPLTVVRIAGIAVIMLGVYLITRS